MERNGNSLLEILENLYKPQEVVLFSGNFGKCCSLTTRKLLNEVSIYMITEITDQSREIHVVIYTVQLTSLLFYLQ